MADFTHVFPNADQFDTMNALLALIAARGSGGMEVTSWKSVQQIVRMGLAERAFPVGYEFATEDSDTGTTIIWVVRAHNHHKAANGNLKYTMTLEMKYLFGSTSSTYTGVQFDAIEAVYHAEDGLVAGTYNITIANQAWYDSDNGKSFQFTLTKAVPAGGQIVFDASYDATLNGKSVQTFANSSSTDIIETATLTEGSGGRNLGTTDGTNNVNHFHRAGLGSNNYAQCALRQWLNSSSKAGSVWTPTNKFDRPPTWATTLAGFMHGMPDEFLEVVQTAVIPCRTNNAFEIDSTDGTSFTTGQTYNLEDKFFVLSRPEIYGTWDSTSIKDGEQLDYYKGLTNTERIKRDNGGTSRRAWLRSLNPTYAGMLRMVETGGDYATGGSRMANGVAAACIIA